MSKRAAYIPVFLPEGKISTMLMMISITGMDQATTKFKLPISGDLANVEANDLMVNNLLAAVYMKSMMNK